MSVRVREVGGGGWGWGVCMGQKKVHAAQTVRTTPPREWSQKGCWRLKRLWGQSTARFSPNKDLARASDIYPEPKKLQTEP